MLLQALWCEVENLSEPDSNPRLTAYPADCPVTEL